jgi:hypothetical protein
MHVLIVSPNEQMVTVAVCCCNDHAIYFNGKCTASKAMGFPAGDSRAFFARSAAQSLLVSISAKTRLLMEKVLIVFSHFFSVA